MTDPKLRSVPKTLYKFLPKADVPAVEAVGRGSFKIGTFRSYSQIESARADSEEGIVTRHIDRLELDGTHPREKEIRDLLRVEVDGPVRVSDTTIRHTIPNIYVLCFSTSPDSAPQTAEAQAVFEIQDIYQIADVLTREHARLGFPCLGNFVDYEARHVDINVDQTTAPNPFVKDTQFEWENEFRLIWPKPQRVPPRLGARTPHETTAYARSGGLESFITPPSKAIAKHVRRID